MERRRCDIFVGFDDKNKQAPEERHLRPRVENMSPLWGLGFLATICYKDSAPTALGFAFTPYRGLSFKFHFHVLVLGRAGETVLADGKALPGLRFQPSMQMKPRPRVRV